MASTTIQISHETKKRIDGYKRHPRATYDETIQWILNEIEKLDEEIVETTTVKLGRRKEDY